MIPLEERIGRYLARCPVAVSGQDGHGATFRVACALVNGFALEPDAALRWMLVYNAGCMPPWSARELRHKVEQARKAVHQKLRGHLLKSNHPDGTDGQKQVWQPIPVRLTPRGGRSRTVRTVFSDPTDNVCARTHIICVGGKEPSVPSGQVIGPKEPELIVEWPPLEVVPGCSLGRPPEIQMADEDWRKLAASGLGEEPLVQLAAQMFGPGCKVIATGRVAP